MAEPAEPKTETTAPAPATAPAPLPRDTQTGKFQKRKSLGSLADRMALKETEVRPHAALPEDEDEPEDEGGSEEPAAEASAAGNAPPKPAPAPPKASPDPTDKAIEKDIASQRVKFSEWKRGETEKLQARINLEYRQHQDKLHSERSAWEKQQKEWEPKITKAERVLSLMDSGDYEGLAKEGGFEDWDKFQSHVLGIVSDPNYKRVRAMERELEERKAKEKRDAEELTVKQQREAEEQAQREHIRQQSAAQAAHRKGLSEAMAKSADKLVRVMAADPPFINAVFAIQRENYDPTTNSTVSPEQAIKMALRGAPRSLHEDLQALRARLNEAFAEDAPPAAAEPAKPKPSKTAVVPSTATVEPAAQGRWKGGAKGKDWRSYSQQKMAEALDAEEQERLKKAARR